MKGLKITSILIFIFLLMCNLSAKDFAVEKKVQTLLSRMTLEEKVGQMVQISVERMAKTYPNVQSPLRLDPHSLRMAIVDYHIGSILNVGTSAHTVSEWHDIITAIQNVAVNETRLKIPILYGIDAIHGASYTAGSTLFPQNIGMAATWNTELMRKNGEITAYEVRASGIPWNFNPVLGLGRQPLWPRLWETFGEDPYLASAMGVAYVKGLEGEKNDIGSPTKVAACIKHYLGYSFPLTGKDRTPAWIPERMLREYFVKPFKAAIDAGAHTLMVNSSEINGIPVHSSHYYLTELLRDELGFQGMVVSDWADIRNLYTREHVADSEKEAVRQAVMAGVDMSMVPLDFSFYNLLLELVKEGAVPESRIDEAVSRILRLKFELGLFDNPFPNRKLAEKFACKEFEEINLQAARESITLLKNNGNILPLGKKTKVLITGPTADKLSYLNGGWTITWQGDREDLYPQEKLTICEAIEAKIGKQKVTFVPGVGVDKAIDIDAAVKAAKKVDVAVVCLGEATYCETPGNIFDLTLPEPQLLLAEALEKAGVPIILILVEGRPRLIRRIADKAKGILLAYLPGIEGGRAVADILFGDVNPSGKLPITYPRYPNDFTLYDHKFSENTSHPNVYFPEFPFGFGLSYTKFEYKNLTLDKESYRMGEPIQVSVTVKNVGDQAAKEAVLLYLCDLYASVTPSRQKLKRFTKIALQPGEEKTVSFTLNNADLSFIGRQNKPIVEPGAFEVKIAELTKTFHLK